MIQHVVEHVRLATLPTRIIVATEDPRIQSAVESFGAESILTRPDHRTGTDRIAEVATHIPADIYINVQGDEPLIDPGTIDAVAAAMLEDDSIQLATPCSAITLPGEIMDPNIVKVVQDFDGRALYFSRAPIPWVRDTGDRVAAKHWKPCRPLRLPPRNVARISHAPPGELERIEQLEQLRWLENGFHMHVVETMYNAVSVDVPTDIQKVEKLLQSRAKSTTQSTN